MTDFNTLRKTRIKDIRAEYRFGIDPEAEEGDNPRGMDVAVIYEHGPFAIVLLPQSSEEFFDLEIHTFIDGAAAAPSEHITLRKEPND